MATLAEIVARFGRVAQDPSHTRWPVADLVDWINEGYRQVVILRPDATAQSAVVALAEGARQRLDDAASINLPDAHALLDCVATRGRNGQAIRRTAQAVMDGMLPSWRNARPTERIERWMIDDRNPREFLVYPPAKAGVELEIVYSNTPAPHDTGAPDLAERLHLHDAYAPAILDYLLYRAYLMDTDSQANMIRATGHLSAFREGLGAKSMTDEAMSPNSPNAE